ncbi:MAG: porin [Limnobacter sp.]|uniref:porin n=1 Tax=Limnobacter sp. TaxID=2003368 RepID=UPI003919DBF2
MKHAMFPKKHRSPLASLLVSGLLLGAPLTSHAGATVSFGEDKSITVGLGLRASFTSTEDGAPNGTSRSKDFNIDSTRLFFSGQLSKTLKGTLNFDRDSTDTIKVLDAYGQFEPSPYYNLWVGRHLSPGDRANMDGPYYLNTATYPGLVSNFPAKFAGRDDGATFFGRAMDGHLNYAVGAFDGRNKASNLPAGLAATTSNQSDSLLYATRVAYHFWDVEPAPAYLTASTYYGAADILTVAVSYQTQKNGVGTNLIKDDYTAMSADVLMEKRLKAGVLTLEGATYSYAFSQAAANVDVTKAATGIVAGDAYLLGAAFLFPEKVGIGKIQPFVRYQKFEADPGVAVLVTKQSDIGSHYVIDGFNARLGLTYSNLERTGLKDQNSVILSMQYIY